VLSAQWIGSLARDDADRGGAFHFRDLNKPQFIGRDALVRQKQEGREAPPRALQDGRQRPAAALALRVYKGDQKIAETTSGTLSPRSRPGSAWPTSRRNFARINEQIEIENPRPRFAAIIEKKPLHSSRHASA